MGLASATHHGSPATTNIAKHPQFQPTSGTWFAHPNLDAEDSLNYPLIITNNCNPHLGTQIACLCAGIPDDEMEANGRLLAISRELLSLTERIATDTDFTEIAKHRAEAQRLVLRMWALS